MDELIFPFDQPLKERAGFLVLKGNLFDFAIMKTSVISEEFRARYLSEPGREGVFEGRAIVLDGSWYRLPSHSVSLTPQDTKTWAQIEPRLRAERFSPPRVRA